MKLKFRLCNSNDTVEIESERKIEFQEADGCCILMVGNESLKVHGDCESVKRRIKQAASKKNIGNLSDIIKKRKR